MLAAACSDSKSTTTSSGATTAKVSVDNKTTFPASFLAYFPKEVKVHAGDTVSFTSVFTGEPHSVSLGTLVTEGLNAADPHLSDPTFDPSTIPQLAAIPPMLPQGPGDANQVSAAPCYVASGNPPGPGETPCPNHSKTPPEFTGSESFFSSGFMPEGDVFNVKLASSVKPGTYRYFCTLHGAEMQGAITVVGSGAKASTAAENQAAGDAELQKNVSALQPSVDAAKNATPDKALAGASSEAAQGASANIFGPPIASIPVGGTVSWTVLGPHTITFKAPDDTKPFIRQDPDGLTHVNEKAGLPAGGGVPQPQPPGGDQGGGGGGATTTTAAVTTTTGGAPPPPTVVDGGSYDGSSYYSTGVYLSFPPDLVAYKLKFTKAGTYSYECLIHPGMAGAVKVGSG
jgi:plastocyanin